VAGSPYAITASAATGGSFNVNNYSISYVNGLLTVNPAPLSVTANNVSITYGDILNTAGFTAAVLFNSDTIGSVTLTLNGATTGTTANVGSYTIVPSNAVFSTGSASNYIISYVNGQLIVNPKAITLYASRNYDTTTIMNANTVGSVYGVTINGVNEYLTLTGTGSLADKNAGYGKPLTLGSLTLGNGLNGELASNYTLVGGQANIYRVPLQVTGITAADKVYDATFAATLVGTAMITPLPGDVVTLNTGTGAAAFNSKNVGNNVIVTLTSYALGGTDAGNYTLTPPPGLSANISKAPVIFSGTPVAANKVYDGTSFTSISGVTVSGLVSGDAAYLVGNFFTPDVGVNKTVSVALTGASAGNYSYTNMPSLTASITQKALSYSGTPVASSRVYDGTNTTTLTGVTLSGIVAGDAVTLSGQFADKNIGTGKAVTSVLSGSKGGNYSLAPISGLTANITAKALTLSGTPVAASRMYDSTLITAIGGASLVGAVSGDSVGLIGLFADPNVGTAKPVTLALAGTDIGNYTISLPGGLTADIVLRSLVVKADNVSMVFGGTLPPLTYSVGGGGLVGADTIASVFAGSPYANVSAVPPGGNTPITQGTLVLTTGSGDNYTISSFVDGELTVQ